MVRQNSKKLPKDLELDAEVRFQATFQNAFVGMAHVGLEGGWLRVNTRLVEMLGYSEDELLDLTFQEITHPDDHAADVNAQEQLNSGAIARCTLEKRFYRKSGKIIWAHVQVATQHDESGELRYYIASVTNITTTKHLERRLRDSAEDIERLLNVLGHELRNPLNAIAATAQLFEVTGRQEPLPNVVVEGIERIQSNVKAAADFLAYVDKMAAFQGESDDLVAISLAEVMDEVLAASSYSLSDTDTRVDIPERLPRVMGQRTAINRVLQNLVDNAIKYRRLDQPCVITVTAENTKNNVLLRIQDTGRGIPADQLKHVFQAAWRATNVGEASGRGLGLAFCYRIMATLDGAISVVSEEGSGTCFALTFNLSS